MYMIGLLVIICLLMPKNSNIYVLVLILHHLLMYTPVLVLISLTTLKNILDLGINVSSDCSFDFHISNLVKRTKYLTGWMLRTFSSCDKLTMLTLFKALVMSRLDYGCQLWSPYLIKHINMVEKVQRSFTRFISGMAGLLYTERLTVLKLYSLQRRRERYIIIYVWKILEGLVPNLFSPICTKTLDRRGRTCISSHISVGRLGTLEYNSFRWCV